MKQNVYLCDDIWIEIKKFIFKQHLWNVPEIKSYNKVVSSLPLTNMSPFIINGPPLVFVSSRFVRITENLSWNFNNSIVTSYICVPENVTVEDFLFENPACRCYGSDYYLGYE